MTVPAAETMVGEFALPDTEAFLAEFGGIFARRYYTNHGPLAQQLEQALAARLQVRYALAMTSSTIATAIAAKALELSGAVIIPAWAPRHLGNALQWAGLRVECCDVEWETQLLDPQDVL